MNITSSHSKKYLLLALFIGIVIGYGLFFLTEDNSDPYQTIETLENRIGELESQLAKKEKSSSKNMLLENSAQSSFVSNKTLSKSTPQQSVEQSFNEVVENAAPAPDTQQILKELGTRNDFNPRTFSERVNDFLSVNPGKENIAIASKAVVDMAENTESMPDFELEAIYQKQTDPDLKRVTAQVLSMRGNNSLLEKQINDAQTDLRNDNPEVRQKTLVELGKTRYAGAANAIAPLLQDKNTSVKLDALLALRATGNESHVRLVQDLINHPDPSVSWLANDVISHIQNFSERARTKVSGADIYAELPPITTQ